MRHTLVGEGAPHDSDGRRINVYHPMWVPPGTVPRLGCGMCSCGEIGPWAESNRARQRWHRQHRDPAASPVPSLGAGGPVGGGE